MAKGNAKGANLFLSYNFADSRFVARVHYHLSKQPLITSSFWPPGDRDVPTWAGSIGKSISEAGFVIGFAGEKAGHTQELEMQAAHARHLLVCIVRLGDDVPDELKPWSNERDVVVSPEGALAARALECASLIAGWLPNHHWVPDDGLPLGYLFDYEKDIIEAYAAGVDGLVDTELFGRGVPERWPSVCRREAAHENRLPEALTGRHRTDDDVVLVDARARIARGAALTFPEAGPRPALHYSRKRQLQVRIVVSGGVAPGTNAVISGIVKRHELYAEQGGGPGASILGFTEGFRGLLRGATMALTEVDMRQAAHRGGSTLPTSRAEQLLGPDAGSKLAEAVNGLHHVDILYVVGGDGSLRAAHALASVARELDRERDRPLAVVGVPKTTDNDILWVWQSFGFLSSVEKAREFILDLHTEVISNPRLCVIQLFGSDSGFVVAHAAVATDVCSAVLVPEGPFLLSKVSDHIKKTLVALRDKRQFTPYGIVLLAETAIPDDADRYLDDRRVELSTGERSAIEQFVKDGRRVRGQTPDDLRSAGLRMVTQVLQGDIKDMGDEWKPFRVFSNEPRHLIRAIAPNPGEVILGQRLGANAVDAAMAGYHDCMVSQWLTEFVLVPLELVVLGRKRLPLEGVFWKSVLASTGQPDFGPSPDR